MNARIKNYDDGIYKMHIIHKDMHEQNTNMDKFNFPRVYRRKSIVNQDIVYTI